MNSLNVEIFTYTLIGRALFSARLDADIDIPNLILDTDE
jgi:hypothetical protein